MTDIIICDPDAGYARTVAQLLSATNGQARHAQSIQQLQTLPSDKSCVVVMGPGVSPDTAFQWAEQNRDRDLPASVVVVTDSPDTDTFRKALRAGVDDVVDSHAAGGELKSALEEARKRAAERTLARVPEAPTQQQQGTVATVFSTKGGVGKTVIATNIGVALAQLGKSVVLVDLDLQFGDVGIMLGLEPARTIVGATQASDRLDESLLSGFLTDHPSGLKVLLAPVRPEDAEQITPGRISRIVDLLSTMFEYVIIDTAASLDETVLTALDGSTKVIAVTMMDVASVKNTRISLQKLLQLGYDDSNLEVLLNRADSKVFLQPDEVEKAIGAKIRRRLPSDQLVPRSVNKGRPLVLDAPKSSLGKVIFEIARALAPAGAVSSRVA